MAASQTARTLIGDIMYIKRITRESALKLNLRRKLKKLPRKNGKICNVIIYVIFFKGGIAKIGKSRGNRGRDRISSYLKPWCKEVIEILIADGKNVTSTIETDLLNRFVTKKLLRRLGHSTEVATGIKNKDIHAFAKSKKIKFYSYNINTIQNVNWTETHESSKYSTHGLILSNK